MIGAGELAGRLGLHRRGRGWAGNCPMCGYKASFSVEIGKLGKPLIYCHNGCPRDALLALAHDGGSGWRREVEDGTRVIVGVNRYRTDEEPELTVFQPDPEAARLALDDLERHRAQRDQPRTDQALTALRDAGHRVMDGHDIGSVTAALVAAADADATLGEMQTVLFEVFGRNK